MGSATFKSETMKKIIACIPTILALLCLAAALLGEKHQILIAAIYGYLAACAWCWAINKEEEKK